MQKSHTRRYLSLGYLCWLLGACNAGIIADPKGSLPGDADGDGIADADDATPLGPGSSQPGAAGSGQPGGAGSGGACADGVCGMESAVTSSAYPRLSHQQWANTARDLLMLDAAPDVSSFTNDAQTGSQFDNNGGKLSVSAGLWGDQQTAAEQLATALSTDTARLAKLVPAEPAGDPAARAKALVEQLGKRAYRRPMTEAEVAAQLALFNQAAALYPDLDAFTAGVTLTVQALLQSPHFLYRVETGAANSGGDIALTDYAIASRLSYMVWDSMPDEALLAKADAGQLHDPVVLATEAKRMLQDPRAHEKLVEFHRQLLELRRYDTLHPKDQPAGIGASMREETERFVRDVVVANDGNLESLLTESYTFVNADLATLYGLSSAFSDAWARVELDANSRSGLLTQAGFLTYRSGDTAPILRGVFINLKLLCADLPPPPVFTPPTPTGVTRRQRVNSITGKGTCGATCHATMINPAGFPLEHFDDVGRYRTEDQGMPIDATAEYEFRDGVQSYDGAPQWGKVMASAAETHECYVRHWLEFGYGREVQDGDAPLIARIGEQSRAGDLSVKNILIALVQSPSFLTRRNAD